MFPRASTARHRVSYGRRGGREAGFARRDVWRSCSGVLGRLVRDRHFAPRLSLGGWRVSAAFVGLCCNNMGKVEV
ncbi:hypothetical protein E2C01_049275 [Portunus trituberculatus]|uniref:Uncharacterized protein n=1 Tax=Portunus trituberculatus TaxID=210409 RepID=A0A5B7GDI0_PORTR|nr:hypothetical protein [Portunus trituberculatus]